MTACAICGDPIPAKSSRGRARVICAKRACDTEIRRRKNRERGCPTLSCEFCGQSFVGPSPDSKRRWCSKQCYRRYNRGDPRPALMEWRKLLCKPWGRPKKSTGGRA